MAEWPSRVVFGSSSLFLVALVVLPIVGTVAAQDAVHLTLTAHDQRGVCDGDRFMCYEVTDGSLDDLEPGTAVNLTLQNEGVSDHNAYVTTLEEADPEHEDTSEEARFAATRDEVASGENATVTFTVPEEADGLYIWCEISGHEASGMWLEVSWASEEPTDPEPNRTDNGSEEPTGPPADTPGPGAALVLGGVAAVALAVAASRR